ncbi:hypothetical protein Dda_0684 [Drechslerella dactyloides]|uniref:Uncharacterized protein n=1 Tax=Drechslerella dactyloides TaxID=74499 RepID=A0AAD6J812_DREDA|nr:hypothetical protein Dda_0684 [Drechslerella dactyloides]
MTANTTERSASSDAGAGEEQKLTSPAPRMSSASSRQSLSLSGEVSIAEDGRTTMPLDFPFELKDAISIFDAIMVKSKEANPFAESIQRDWHSQIWMSIRFHANFPKMAGSSGAASTGSPKSENLELKEHVTALMKGLEEARNKEIHKVYIENANVKSRDRTVSHSENQAAKDKFLHLVQAVYRLWRQRNDRHLPPSEAPLLLPPILPPAKSDIGVQTQMPTTASLPDSAAGLSLKPSGSEKTGAVGLPSPADTSDTISDRTDADEASKSRSPSQATARENCHLITLPIATPPPNTFANSLHIAEIWRVTINRLYASHNGSLTKFRRPNWLLHLETRGVQTVSDLGGWRGGDESTRQLTNNLITKLHETGYSTKGIQSKIKSILTVDISQALENLRSGNFEKFKPVPLDLMRNAWAPDASTPHSTKSDAVETPSSSIRPVAHDDSMLDYQGYRKRPVEVESENSSRAKRVRLASDEAIPFAALRNSASDSSEYTTSLRRQSTSSNIPVSALVHATVESGFTPINRTSFTSIGPSPSVPVEQQTPTISKMHAPTESAKVIQSPTSTRAPVERPRSPASTIDQREQQERQDQDMSSADEFQSTADDAVEIFVEGRLNSFRQTIQDLRKELVETRQAQADHASIVEKARDEFDSFKKDFHEDYCRVRNVTRDNTHRIKALEADPKTNSAGATDTTASARTHAQTVQQLEDAKTKVSLLSNLLQYRDSGLSEHIDGLLDNRVSELDAAATDKVNDLETRISTNVEELGTKLDNDMKQLASANEEVKDRMDKLEAKMESVDADVKEIMNAISAIMLKVMGSRSSAVQGVRI